ncbi:MULTISPECIES: S26 family signal peptidase [unclassified Mesorhizobium]|uniref:S26 family signal peptidase n=1 Tax=unclassified Mesorhizobium TaxID=325217 RepID=UPI000FCAD2D3|nr:MULTISPECIES: S26 family signal peptidase [unclassified Mesorhizobium]RUV16124.1 S26 family signal peptidase [Mesorhizobium sp. M1A.F.Ca.IN.022.04.1.1]RWG31494.1 MAG: S26 family signal peptidase [Mesorhizobium sp.]
MTRAAIILAGAAATLAIGFPAFLPMPVRLVWNASASAPLGLYRIDNGKPPAVGDLVVVNAPEPLAAFLAGRGYLPKGVPLLKHILAASGQSVCRSGLTITVDGAVAGMALQRDRVGRALPVWQGCRSVATGEVFLMNRRVRDSLDGRYFGLIPRDRIIGRAFPLWTYGGDDGRFERRAPMR